MKKMCSDFSGLRGMTMCGTWAYNKYREYAAVFPAIVDILSASGVKAEVEDNADKTGLLVKVALPHQTTADRKSVV